MTPIVVDTESDNPFAIDVARWLGQREDVADLISLRSFANGEFCPVFINEDDGGKVGRHLEGRSRRHRLHGDRAPRIATNSRCARCSLPGPRRTTAPTPSTSSNRTSSTAPRIADLDRTTASAISSRDENDFRKFDGQPFSARDSTPSSSDMSGIDAAITVHNHSASVGHEFNEHLAQGYHNLSPAEVFAHYVLNSDVIDTGDDGASALDLRSGSRCTRLREGDPRIPRSRFKVRIVEMVKERFDERSVRTRVADDSEVGASTRSGAPTCSSSTTWFAPAAPSWSAAASCAAASPGASSSE